MYNAWEVGPAQEGPQTGPCPSKTADPSFGHVYFPERPPAASVELRRTLEWPLRRRRRRYESLRHRWSSFLSGFRLLLFEECSAPCLDRQATEEKRKISMAEVRDGSRLGRPASTCRTYPAISSTYLLRILTAPGEFLPSWMFGGLRCWRGSPLNLGISSAVSRTCFPFGFYILIEFIYR